MGKKEWPLKLSFDFYYFHSWTQVELFVFYNTLLLIYAAPKRPFISALFFPKYNMALGLISQLKVFASNVYLLPILLYISIVYCQLHIEVMLLVSSYTI